MGDYVGDPYPCAKFYHHTITPSALQICENAHQVTRYETECFFTFMF